MGFSTRDVVKRNSWMIIQYYLSIKVFKLNCKVNLLYFYSSYEKL